MPEAPGLVLSPTATVADDVVLGAHVVIHDGVTLGAGVVVGDHAVLGKAPRLSPGSAVAGRPVEPLVVEAGASIGAGAVVNAGARLGEGVIVGDQAYVRERAIVGTGSLVGRGATVDCDVVVGARVKLQTNVYLTAFSTVEDDVFVGPCAVTTNDDTMARMARGGEGLQGVALRRACRVGGGAVLTPGVEVGEEAFVAAGAVVTADVPARAVVMGVPARVVRRVPDDQLLERWR